MLPGTKNTPRPTGMPAGNSERVIVCACGAQYAVPVNAVKAACPSCSRPLATSAAVHQR